MYLLSLLPWTRSDGILSYGSIPFRSICVTVSEKLWNRFLSRAVGNGP